MWCWREGRRLVAKLRTPLGTRGVRIALPGNGSDDAVVSQVDRVVGIVQLDVAADGEFELADHLGGHLA